MCLCVSEMLASCLVVAIVAALYEGLKVIRDCLLRKAWSVSCNGEAVAVPTTDILIVETVKLPHRCVRRVIFLFHIYSIGHLHYFSASLWFFVHIYFSLFFAMLDCMNYV